MKTALTLILFAINVLLGAGVFVSCATETESAVDHSGLNPMALVGRTLYQSETLGLPGAMAFSGDTLLVLDLMGQPAIHLLGRRSGSLLTTRGAIGDGPGRFEAPIAMDVLQGAGSVWILDAQHQRLTSLPLGLGRGVVDTGTIEVRANGPIIDFVLVNPHRILAHGFLHGGRLALLDPPGAGIRYSGALPDNPLEAPANVLQHAYQGSLAPRPDRELFVLTTRHASWFEVFDSTGARVRRFSGPFRFEPDFAVDRTHGRPVLATPPEFRFGYIDVAATQDRLYALFSGRTRVGWPERANYGEYVHVFDWFGRLLGVLQLDRDAFTLAVDQEAGLLYATQHLPAPSVTVYSLEGAR